jgi:ubiquinone/menaquinone biosynthesis C-methylase UbiE/ADP-ribose pyrophosphatase YjhB (NUDIX family)
MAQSILVWLLFEKDGAVLLGKRKAGREPFAGQWTLPGAVMPEHESADETLTRVAAQEFGVQVTGNDFFETLYVSEGGENYVTNIFRVIAHEGALRFRRDSDYEEVSWFSPVQLAGAAFLMPAPLRALLRAEDAPGGRGVPDNRAAWDAISHAYQQEHRLKTDAAHYGPRMPTENDLRLLGEVRGKRILEIGCGGGQCSIAFARQGAIATGIDQSSVQLDFARQLAVTEGVRVEFIEEDITTLPQVKNASQDAVFSACALGYVEDIPTCFAEVARVLRPGGLFVFSVGHPVRNMIADEDRFSIARPYWDGYQEWEWGAGSGVWLRDWSRTVEEWFGHLRGAGFTVDRIVEPRMLVDAHDESWDDTYPLEQGLVVPPTLIFKAVKGDSELHR